MSLYFELLAKTVEATQLDPARAEWAELPLPTSDGLEMVGERIAEHILRGELFPSLYKGDDMFHEGHSAEQRPAKTLKRIVAKAANPPKIYPHFKIHSDLMGFRIKCDWQSIELVTKQVVQDLKSYPDSIVRVEKNLFDEHDIIQRVYAYIPDRSPAVMEILIGHPFALEVFRINSLQRDHPEFLQMYPNYFTSGIYEKVKEAIKDECEHTSGSEYASEVLYAEKAANLYDFGFNN